MTSKLTRRSFIKYVAGGATFLSLSGMAKSPKKIQSSLNTKQNFLLIAIDDLKPVINAYGESQIITPNIDKLAKKGTTFLNNQCQWPVCGPSRASFMTGLRPESTGVMDLKTKMREATPGILSMPEYLKKNGYETAGCGKVYDPRCVSGGHRDDDPESWSIPYKGYRGNAIDRNPQKLSTGAPDVGTLDLVDGGILNQGLALMDKMAKGDKPFFLAVGFKKPHLPFIAPKKYWDMYDRKKIKTALFQKPAKGMPVKYALWNSKEFRSYSDIPKEGILPIDQQKKSIHGYYACVTYIDDLIGRLMAEYYKLGLDKNTTVILLGDHGFHLGDHTLWGKHSELEQADRAPLIVYSPYIHNPNNKTTSPSEFLDIFPTVCEIANLPIPKQLEGKSLVPILRDGKNKVKEGAITTFKRKGARGYSYRTERYRYIEWIGFKFHKIVARELYDYQTDPLETVNLAVDPKYKDLVITLAKQLRKEGQKGCPMLFEVDAVTGKSLVKKQ